MVSRAVAEIPPATTEATLPLLANLPQKAKEVSALFGLDLQRLNPVKESITVSLLGPTDSDPWSKLNISANVKFDGAYTLDEIQMEGQIQKTARMVVADVMVQMNVNMAKEDVTIAALHTAASQGLAKRKSIGNYTLTEKGKQIMTGLLNKRRNEVERLLETLPAVYEEAQPKENDSQKAKHESAPFGFDLQQLNPAKESTIVFLWAPTDSDPLSILEISASVRFDGTYTLNGMQMKEQIQKDIRAFIADVIVQMNRNMEKEDMPIDALQTAVSHGLASRKSIGNYILTLRASTL